MGTSSREGSQSNLSAKSPHRPSSFLHTLTHPPPFLPPKKGILKSRNYDVTKSVSCDLDDAGIVLKNTVDNEYVNVYRRSALSPAGASASISSTESPETADREVPFVVASATTKVRPHSDHVSPVSPEKSSKAAEPASHRASVTSSEASTPSSLDDAVWRSMLSGESLGVNHRPLSTHFALPAKSGDRAATPSGDQLRSVTVTRSCSDDRLFGLCIHRAVKDGKPVLLVEAAHAASSPFVPGDQLVAVDDAAVEDKDLDEVVRMLTNSTSQQVTVQVRAAIPLSTVSQKKIEALLLILSE
jgi:hypothetical protein